MKHEFLTDEARKELETKRREEKDRRVADRIKNTLAGDLN
jgi:hypothetical protein